MLLGVVVGSQRLSQPFFLGFVECRSRCSVRLHKRNAVESVLPVVVCLGAVGDDFVIGRSIVPTPLAIRVFEKVEVHGYLRKI